MHLIILAVLFQQIIGNFVLVAKLAMDLVKDKFWKFCYSGCVPVDSLRKLKATKKQGFLIFVQIFRFNVRFNFQILAMFFDFVFQFKTKHFCITTKNLQIILLKVGISGWIYDLRQRKQEEMKDEK